MLPSTWHRDPSTAIARLSKTDRSSVNIKRVDHELKDWWAPSTIAISLLFLFRNEHECLRLPRKERFCCFLTIVRIKIHHMQNKFMLYKIFTHTKFCFLLEIAMWAQELNGDQLMQLIRSLRCNSRCLRCICIVIIIIDQYHCWIQN